MGMFREGPPADFIEKVRNEFGIDTFIETGTYHAKTSLWASERFSSVFTIEAFKPIFDENTAKYSNNKKIKFIFGSSKDKLSEVISQLTGPSVIWLDAHYSGDGTFGEDNKCPLMDEIRAVNNSGYENVILIDDARVFLSPSTVSHKPVDWPNIVEVINQLNMVPGRYIIILDDVIFAVPERMKQITARYAQEINSINNLANSGSREFLKKIIRYVLRKIKKI